MEQITVYEMGTPMNYNESLAYVLTQRILFKSQNLPDYTGVEGTFNSHKVKIKGFFQY